MSLREYSMINWNARYDEIAIGDVDEEEKCSLTLIGDGVAYCDTLMHDFDEWIIEIILLYGLCVVFLLLI